MKNSLFFCNAADNTSVAAVKDDSASLPQQAKPLAKPFSDDSRPRDSSLTVEDESEKLLRVLNEATFSIIEQRLSEELTESLKKATPPPATLKGRPLGSGTFGTVFALSEDDAVKVIEDVQTYPHIEVATKREAAVLFCEPRFRHRNIICGKGYHFFYTQNDDPELKARRMKNPNTVYLVLPRYEKDLMHLLKHIRPSPDQIKHIIFQIFDGLRHMHDCMKIRHGDIKPENIHLGVLNRSS
jgi:hypothetical protein